MVFFTVYFSLIILNYSREPRPQVEYLPVALQDKCNSLLLIYS